MAAKKKCQMKHLKRRWLERVGSNMNQKLHDQIVIMIKHGESKIVRKTSNRVTIHAVTVDGKEHTVAYDKLRKQLVTVLPKEDPGASVQSN